jgi:transcriptional regulator with XRE-family HTH domain
MGRQVDMARQLGVSRAYISMLVSGKRKPSKQLTKKLQKLTGEANFGNGVQVVGGSNPLTPIFSYPLGYNVSK